MTTSIWSDRSVDVAFPLDALSLRRDHAQALKAALCSRLPWLETDLKAGIHPIKIVQGSGELALLPRRARLLIRVGIERVDALASLAGSEFDVDGCCMQLGAPQVREHEPHATLYAYRVAAQSQDEVVFMTLVNSELTSLGIGGEPVCGLRSTMRVAGQVLNTFSLMLHGLSAAQSLQLQRVGLGSARLLGCGVFVPHKSAAAVR